MVSGGSGYGTAVQQPPTDLTALQTQLDELQRLRASGARRVRRANGSETEYQTGEELAAAIVDLERRIAALKGGRITTIQIHSSKGLGR